MTRTTALIRSADPVDQFALPDHRAEYELAALIGSPPTPVIKQERVARQRGPMLVTAVVLAALVVVTALITTVVPREQPADGINRAQQVMFGGSPASQARDRRAIATLLASAATTEATDRQIGAALSHSAQLRPPAGSQGSGWGLISAGVGPARIPQDSSADIEGQPVGGAGTGSDEVTVLIVRCSGSGSYRWTVQGHTLQSPINRTIATATGSCADGITAARYILGGKVVTTAVDLDVDEGVSYSIASLGWGPFNNPVLDDPFTG